jgi:Flp pilus assembly protein TadG
VELAIVAPVLATIIFTAVDFGRMGQYQNRLSNAAREGAAMVQVDPTAVNTGCRGTRNAFDAAAAQNTELAAMPGFSVTVAKKDVATGVLTPFTGCGTASGGVTLVPGDRLVVTVKVRMTMTSPVTIKQMGRTPTLSRSTEVVVQG